ncbi:pyridine nucleotide-disulfide oxidoreductase [Alicyclobacillaceae bacterium I2511]|nr:pyridine nucleotide-disulfide oxidoreductase [Alicyclobacillaceae bacterium I2511]
MANTTQRKVVVIGGVALGAGVAAKVRREDEQAEIIMIERGPFVSFANCGLPYYLSGVIEDREALLLHTPESLRNRFNIDVRVLQEATGIQRDRKVVHIRNLQTGVSYDQPYDKLVLAMGADPIVPHIPGLDLNGIFQVRTVPDADSIRSWMADPGVHSAVVIGAGFIGIETVENLVHAGLHVTLIEKAPQVLPVFDIEMTALVLSQLQDMGVDVLLGDGIRSFEGDVQATSVTLESGKTVAADMFILGMGVRPNTQLARTAGLELGPNGALHLNQYLQTSDPDIYGGGDMAEIVHLVDGERRWIPLAGPANKQARIIGQNVCGKTVTFHGAQGTSIVGIGDVVLGITGLSEQAANALEIPNLVSYNTLGHHAGYYPGALDITIKLIFDPTTGRLLGGQVAGQQGVDKRLDVLATAIYNEMTVSELTELDLAYAPPFSSAKDPLIMAGMVAENLLNRSAVSVYEPTDLGDSSVLLLDVRSDREVALGMLPGAKHIPLDQLRQRVHELDRNKPVIVYCRIGQRSYFASRFLRGQGFTQVYTLNGGYVVEQMRETIAASNVTAPLSHAII